MKDLTFTDFKRESKKKHKTGWVKWAKVEYSQWYRYVRGRKLLCG